jgi:hypothetical protein
VPLAMQARCSEAPAVAGGIGDPAGGSVLNQPAEEPNTAGAKNGAMNGVFSTDVEPRAPRRAARFPPNVQNVIRFVKPTEAKHAP